MYIYIYIYFNISNKYYRIKIYLISYNKYIKVLFLYML